MNQAVIHRAIQKASQSSCHYRVSAIGFSKRGDMVCCYTNKPRFSRLGGGMHAEMRVVRSNPGVRTILICRIGAGGALLPIHPCKRCKKVLDKMGVRIITVTMNGVQYLK